MFFFVMSAFLLNANTKNKKENYAAAQKRSLLSFFEEHILNCLHCSEKITQDIILAIQLAKKVPFKVSDTIQKKVPRYRQKGTNFQKYRQHRYKKAPRYNCTRYCPPLDSYISMWFLFTIQ